MLGCKLQWWGEKTGKMQVLVAMGLLPQVLVDNQNLIGGGECGKSRMCENKWQHTGAIAASTRGHGSFGCGSRSVIKLDDAYICL